MSSRINLPATPLKTVQQAIKLHNAGKLKDAAQLYRLLAETYPSVEWSAHLWDIELSELHAQALEQSELGNFAEACRLWRKAVELSPEQLGFFMSLMRSEPENALVREELYALDPEKVRPQFKHPYHWSVWRALDWESTHLCPADRKCRWEAWWHLEAANAAARENIAYDEVATIQYYRRIMLANPTPAKQVNIMPTVPIFIVGLPRSGTTLVEHILGAHPEVHAAGELEHLNQLLPPEGFPEKILPTAAQDYLSAIKEETENFYCTDKMPDNARFLGFIHHSMPAAKIIWCRRNIMDVGLSYFAESFQRGHFWSYDQGELARFIVAHERMMAHWCRKGIPMLEVQYEHVVQNLKAQTRRMLDYLCLSWEDRCLRFHETTRHVRTASLAQVRKPIYATSVSRWRRYEQQLKPMLTIFKQAGFNPDGQISRPGGGDTI